MELKYNTSVTFTLLQKDNLVILNDKINLPYYTCLIENTEGKFFLSCIKDPFEIHICTNLDLKDQMFYSLYYKKDSIEIGQDNFLGVIERLHLLISKCLGK